MKKQIDAKFDKTKIAKLPRVTFDGRTIVVLSQHEAEQAVNFLLAQPILGIDTETRPSFKKGVSHKVALLQVATKDICFLFRLNYIGMSPSIVRLLEDTNVLKVGLSLRDDILSLHKLGPFEPGWFVDIQDCMKKMGVEDMSLQKLYANFFGKRISKGQQLSNWEADVLSDKQKTYAATDAWACIHLYEEWDRLMSSGDFVVMKTEDNDNVSENHT